VTTPMTDETRAFFDQPHVREFVAAARAEAPGAEFCVDPAGDMLVIDEPSSSYTYLFKHQPRAFRAMYQATPGSLRSDFDPYAKEGRALIDETLGTGSAGPDGTQAEPAAEVCFVPSHETKPPAEPRPVCACGQTIWPGPRVMQPWIDSCGDCTASWNKGYSHGPHAVGIDARIAAVKPAEADPASDWSAWAHASSEGEGW